MQHSDSRLKQAILIFSIAFILAGCGAPGQGGATSTPSGLLSKQQAINAARENAASSRPEVSGALVTPANVQAELMPLGEAQRRLGESTPSAGGESADTPVWYVTMEGLWAGEASAPGTTLAATQPPYHSFTLILDARTGLEIESLLRP